MNTKIWDRIDSYMLSYVEILLSYELSIVWLKILVPDPLLVLIFYLS